MLQYPALTSSNTVAPVALAAPNSSAMSSAMFSSTCKPAAVADQKSGDGNSNGTPVLATMCRAVGNVHSVVAVNGQQFIGVLATIC